MHILPGHPHSGGVHFCTGTLITRTDILTSEHCLEDERLNTIQIVVETIDLRNGQVFHPFWWLSYNQWIARGNDTYVFNVNDLANIKVNMSTMKAVGVYRDPNHI